jgi:hypothetical protein
MIFVSEHFFPSAPRVQRKKSERKTKAEQTRLTVNVELENLAFFGRPLFKTLIAASVRQLYVSDQ